MKNLPFLLAMLLAFPTANAVENTIRIGGHDVSVSSEQSPDPPKACHAALLEKIKKQGWHDEIYNSAMDNKAFLVFSQRVIERGALSKFKFTFWKASTDADGKTKVESQVFFIEKTAVNAFLDDEIKPLFLKFSH
jgi:hypothetical protein